MKMNLAKSFKKGFTLIELLVVVAIIGILASVVLASLNTARTKGADAAVKADMANIRAQAELWYDDAAKGNGKYNTTAAAVSSCANVATNIFSDTNILAAINHITAQAAAPSCAISTDGQKWAMGVTLKSTTTWCVDNSGSAKAGTVIASGICS